jgi:hypothetical protein
MDGAAALYFHVDSLQIESVKAACRNRRGNFIRRGLYEKMRQSSTSTSTSTVAVLVLVL